MTDESKAWGQWRMALRAILSPFDKYGQGVYIAPVIEQIAHVTRQLNERLSGKDIPIVPPVIRDINDAPDD